QAEDGIRDFHVTRVQTCALPISSYLVTLKPSFSPEIDDHHHHNEHHYSPDNEITVMPMQFGKVIEVHPVNTHNKGERDKNDRERSEERRVGKESRKRE